MQLLIGIALGLAVGWLIPRPAWFEALMDKIKAKLDKADDTE